VTFQAQCDLACCEYLQDLDNDDESLTIGNDDESLTIGGSLGATGNNSQAEVGSTTGGALFGLLLLVLLVAFVVVRRRKRLQQKEQLGKRRSSAVVPNPLYACTQVHSISSVDDTISSSNDTTSSNDDTDTISSNDTANQRLSVYSETPPLEESLYELSVYSETPPLEESLYEECSESTGMHVNAVYEDATTVPVPDITPEEQYLVPLAADEYDMPASYDMDEGADDAAKNGVEDNSYFYETPEYELPEPVADDVADENCYEVLSVNQDTMQSNNEDTADYEYEQVVLISPPYQFPPVGQDYTAPEDSLEEPVANDEQYAMPLANDVEEVVSVSSLEEVVSHRSEVVHSVTVPISPLSTDNELHVEIHLQ